MVLKTDLSEREKEIFPDLKHKYYVTEKNDIGIIWSLFYSLDEAINMKTEHNGDKFKRDNVYTLKHKHLKKDNMHTVADLKSYFENHSSTHYHLFFKNCNFYAQRLYSMVK